MRQIFLCMLLIIATLGLTVTDASARGFGGGRSFGMMRSKGVFTHSQRTPRATATAASRSANSNRWRGALSGLLIGSLLTSLFMGHGLGSGLFSWLLLGMAVYFIVNLIRRKKQADLR